MNELLLLVAAEIVGAAIAALAAVLVRRAFGVAGA